MSDICNEMEGEVVVNRYHKIGVWISNIPQ